MLSSAPLQTGQRRRPATRIPLICVVDLQLDDYQGWDELAAARGAQLRILGSAEEALKLARTTSIDLWVVNTELPGLSGGELCAMLHTQSPRIPVYLVANEYSEELERTAYRNGARLFAVKPGHATLAH